MHCIFWIVLASILQLVKMSDCDFREQVCQSENYFWCCSTGELCGLTYGSCYNFISLQVGIAGFMFGITLCAVIILCYWGIQKCCPKQRSSQFYHYQRHAPVRDAALPPPYEIAIRADEIGSEA